MTEPDFTQDVVGNGTFGDDVKPPTTEAEPRQAEIPKGTDDNVAEDRKIFVGGLSWETKEPQLKEYFEKFGEVESVNLKVNAVTGKSRCFAFVVFKNSADLASVFGAGDHAINSKKVDVKRAKAKPGKVFIGGLKPEMTDDEIRDAFSPFGTITEFEMPFDKQKNQRKSFGFITFEREETMKELVKKQKVMVGEVEVDVRKATPKNDYYSGAMGGYGGWYGDYYGGYGYGDYYGGYGYDYYGGYGHQGGGKMRGRGGASAGEEGSAEGGAAPSGRGTRGAPY